MTLAGNRIALILSITLAGTSAARAAGPNPPVPPPPLPPPTRPIIALDIGGVCTPPPGYRGPSPKRAAGAACAHAVDCADGFCIDKVCRAGGAVQGCEAKFGAGFHGVLAASCNAGAVSPVCLPPDARSKVRPECAINGCCDEGSACTDHAQCCSGTCFAPPGASHGACVANTTAYGEQCPMNHDARIWSKTDPVAYCVPAPPACAQSGCLIDEVAVLRGARCLRRTSGEVFCWGTNTKQQLGDGTTTARKYPTTPVPKLTDAVGIAGANTEFCAVRATGRVLCWGEGQPPHELAVDGVAQLSMGDEHRCAVTKAGKVLCWGKNAVGQLGSGNDATQETPIEVLNLTDMVQVSAGMKHTCALQRGGKVFCWGEGGKLGNGAVANSFVPVQVSGLTDATQIATSAVSCAVRRDGSLSCWKTLPATVSGVANVRAVTMAYSIIPQMIMPGQEPPPTPSPPDVLNRACVVEQNGGVSCWLIDRAMARLSITAQSELYDGAGKPLVPRPFAGGKRATLYDMDLCTVRTTGEIHCGTVAFSTGHNEGLKSVPGTAPLP